MIENDGFYIDDVKVKERGTGVVASAPFYLFACYQSGNLKFYLPQRKYTAKIYCNGLLVRDYIPVRVGTTGYLYDRVSGQLFGNQGTGDFVLGPDIVPVEYIESHGTEWIDTGFKANTTTTRLECSLMLTDTSSNMGLFGSRNSQGTASTSSCNAFWINTSNLRLDWMRGTAGPTISASGNTWYNLDITGGYVDVNGNTQTSSRDSIDQLYNFLLFNFTEGNGSAYSTPMIGRFAYARLYSNATPVHDFIPVRVGTGSTWEGAMMDTLTRRIYRNQGSGAFTYGNDLQYSIIPSISED